MSAESEEEEDKTEGWITFVTTAVSYLVDT